MEATFPERPVTLFVSREPRLLETRVALLQQTGITVLPAELKDVPAMLRSYEFQALVLCNTLTVQEKREVIAQVRFLYPAATVVSIHTAGRENVVDSDVEMESPITPPEWQGLSQRLRRMAASQP